MSTFRGVVDEFPDIRIDFFRPILGLRPPRTCFLSHVHSDHLVGLDTLSFHGCFIYCSASTREILLRLEKYPHRLNFQKGILEKRTVTYKHLEKLLKTIPLKTPTRIELTPGNYIQVTLFDANHCTGAVMFLIENENKAILYTGDIRSEPWFVNNLTRNPIIIEYTSGLKTLDCIYLDTSNVRDIPFPTKANGLKELLQKVSKYPADTVFHFSAWTFGYEEVWMALSRTLKSQIHVDDYKMRLYESLCGKPKDSKDPTDDSHLSGPFLAHEGPALTGYKCGNTPQLGCLTSDPNVRIHSCEKGLHCQSLNEKTVWIRPIITRTKYGEMAEVGVGGGGGDLKQRPELVLDSESDIERFLGLFGNTEDLVMMNIKRMFRDAFRSHQTSVSLDDMNLDQGKLSLTKIAEIFAQSISERQSANLSERLTDKALVQAELLPRVITFPYSRHSSYAELCHLVRVFNPKDIYPCTVDVANWDEEISMQKLFGAECSATKFRHDDEMRELQAERYTGHNLQYTSQQTHTTATSESLSEMLPPSSPVQRLKESGLAQRIPQNATRGSVIVRSNSRGQLRPFDADGNEHVSLSNAMDEVISTIESTPPQDIITVSPGSASQNLRRKVILEGLGDSSPTKRPRLEYGGPGSSPPRLALSSRLKPTLRTEHNLPGVLEISDDLDNAAPTLSSDMDSVSAPIIADVSLPPVPDAFSAIQTSNREGIQPVEDPYIRKFVDFNSDREDNTFIDHEDNVVRCKSCGWEVWTVWMTQIGFCCGDCKESRTNYPKEDPYYEVINPKAGPRPGFAPGNYAEYHIENLPPQYRTQRNVVGDYLEYHSDAYDTMDEDPDYRSEYDSEDSFIDDASLPGSERGDEDSHSSSGEERTDYKQLLNELQRKHHRLVDVYESSMRDLVDSDYEYHGNSLDGLNDSDLNLDIDEIDGGGALMVGVAVPDPAVAELVLSQAEEQSQESEISAGRIRDRVRAFEAAAGDSWNNISMVSTGDNHTREEIEL